MQIYKKKFKPYLITGLILLYVFFVIGNFFMGVTGYNMFSRLTYLMSQDLEVTLNDTSLNIFFMPTFLGLGMGLLAFLGTLLAYVRDNDKGVYRNDEEHGSARFAKLSEIKKFEDELPENNIIFTNQARMGLYSNRLSYEAQKNKNTVVVGGPGSGKTFTYIKPNIMQMNASFVTTDPKGLLVHEMGDMLVKNGYKLKIFDLANLTNSNQFNVFHYIKNELDVDRVLEAITEGTKKSDNNGEDFWMQAEALLIRSFIAFLWFDGQDNDYLPHLGMIGDMLRLTERKDPKVKSPVEEWFEEQNEKRPNNYAYKQWTLFNDLYNGETRMSVLAIAASRYGKFDHSQLVDLVREDNMDIESWNEEKTAVFIVIPETSDSFNFIASIFISTAMEVLRKKADDILTGKLVLKEGVQFLHIRWLFDEIANIGRIPNLDKALATFRSRDMSIVLILQALDQLKTMYPKGWATLVNTCDSFLFLGGDEKETTEYLSKRAGKQTISLRKSTISRGKGGSSENRDKMARDLLTPDEIGRINGSDALLFIAGQHVFKDKKYIVPNHPNAPLLANKPTDINWHRYKRFMNDVEELMDKINPSEIVNHGKVYDDAA